MPDMTLQEALQTPEVKSFIGDQVRESVDEALAEALGGDELKESIGEAVKAAVTEALPTLRETVTQEVQQGGQVRDLHAQARQLIEDSPLKGAAKTNLLEDYGLVESGEDVKPGRALALIEAEVDAEGKTVKSAKDVLRESVTADIARQRNILRESAPTMVFAPGGGGADGDAAPAGAFLGDTSPVAQRMRDKGLDPAQFGATPKPEAAKA